MRVAKVTVMYAVPVDEFSAAFPARADVLLRDHLIRCFEAVQAITTISVGTTNFEVFFGARHNIIRH